MVPDRSKARWRTHRVFRFLALPLLLMGFSACAPNRGAVVVAAPGPQARIVTVLPAGHAWVTHGAHRYGFHDGTFYRWVPAKRHYVVVAAPYGAAVRVVPRGYKVRRVGGVEYFVYRGVHYKPTRRKGKTVYIVTKP